MDALYFILSVIGGFFVIGIPFSGLILITLRRNKPGQPVTTNDATHDTAHGAGRQAKSTDTTSATPATPTESQ